MTVRIKLCGITQYEDARVAVSLGVDALGFIFIKKSSRYISPEKAGEIIKQLPPYVSRVGVFANQNTDKIMETAQTAGLDTIQLHGDESPETAASLPYTVVKAFGVGPDFDLSVLDRYDVSAFLLDTWKDGGSGGTGATFDWSVARRAVDEKKKIILAGGLGPSNVEEAVDAVNPYAVDINSGVEIRPGVKNPHKLKELVKIIRNHVR